MRRVLVVGGTGMLAPAVSALVDAGATVLLVARRPDRVPAAGTGHVVPVRGDWTAPATLATAVEAAGGIGIAEAIAWVHSPYRQAVHDALAPLLATDAIVVDLHGSASADPHRSAPPVPAVHVPPRRYRRLVLGFAGPPGSTRWLTHQEISDAAVAALTEPAPVQVAGRTSPWRDRP